MRNAPAVFILLAICFAAPSSRAQTETPKVEIYGGYDYVRFNITSNVSGFAPSESVNLNGGGGQVEYNLNRWLGAVGDFTGYYGTTNGGSGGAFSYLFGPRVNWRRDRFTPFAQVLLGGFASTSGIATSGLQNHFALAAGGGVDIQVTKLIAIRPVQAEYFLTTIPDGLNSRQNSFRFSAGVVFRLGKK
jgi:outer membrane immunogenic protein